MSEVEKIKQICREKGFFISQLERECGFGRGYLAKLKDKDIPSDRLAKIAKFLEVPVTELMEKGSKKCHKEKCSKQNNKECCKTAPEVQNDEAVRSLTLFQDDHKLTFNVIKNHYSKIAYTDGDNEIRLVTPYPIEVVRALTDFLLPGDNTQDTFIHNNIEFIKIFGIENDSAAFAGTYNDNGAKIFYISEDGSVTPLFYLENDDINAWVRGILDFMFSLFE